MQFWYFKCNSDAVLVKICYQRKKFQDEIHVENAKMWGLAKVGFKDDLNCKYAFEFRVIKYAATVSNKS